MATRSGLDSQAGFKNEAVVGTEVVVDHFLEYDNEDFVETPTWLENEGLRAGRKYKRDSRAGIVRYDVNGKLDVKVPTKNLGLLIKHMIASAGAPVQIAATTAYQQIHTPGDHVGKGLTVQIGRPEPGTGTVRPFTYRGNKCTQWELSVSDGEALKLSTTWDGWRENTATGLAAATYTSGANVFNFSHATLKLGGTATTGGTTPQISVAAGVTVATIINSLTIRGENPMATERFGVGNAGVKAEQLENDYPTLTGSLDAEFSKVELYDLFKTGVSTALQLTFSVGDAGGSNPYLFDVIIPKIRLKTAPPSVDGPGLVRMNVDWEMYDDEVNAPYQIKLVSTDTAL